MNPLKITIASISIILTLSGSACRAEDTSNQKLTSLPTSMLGTWQVTEVLTDKGNPAVGQGLDDKYLVPKYLGRILTLAPKRLSINTPRDIPCEDPKLSSRNSTASEIIAKSISTRFSSPSLPTAQDMRLPLANDAPVKVLYLSCNDGLRAKDMGMSALADMTNVLWFIGLDNNRLAMNWHDQTVLILSRVSENTKPVASFNCAKAETAVEKTICGSIGLAAYDKSLTQVYQLVLAYYQSKPNTKTNIADFKKFQKEWVTQRDRCGTDAQCLEKVMSLRIDDIIYDLGDYISQNK